jgi:hypothetical protein
MTASINIFLVIFFLLFFQFHPAKVDIGLRDLDLCLAGHTLCPCHTLGGQFFSVPNTESADSGGLPAFSAPEPGRIGIDYLLLTIFY